MNDVKPAWESLQEVLAKTISQMVEKNVRDKLLFAFGLK